jgi:hypothetical protein
MAIRVPRTWFNGLVDDNGTGNGTLWNKAAISGGIDATDQAFAQLDGLNAWQSYAPVSSIGTASAGFTVFGGVMFLWGYTGGTLPGVDIGWLTFTIPAGYSLALSGEHYLGTAGGAWGASQELLGVYPLNATTLKIRRISGVAFPANASLSVTWGALPLFVVPTGAEDEETRTPPIHPEQERAR